MISDLDHAYKEYKSGLENLGFYLDQKSCDGTYDIYVFSYYNTSFCIQEYEWRTTYSSNNIYFSYLEDNSIAYIRGSYTHTRETTWSTGTHVSPKDLSIMVIM